MKVFCILGDDRVFHSRSPEMHTRVLERRGIPGTYVPFAVDADQLAAAVEGLRALGIAGANVTVPHKERILAHIDTLSEEARAIGAVNTLVPYGGQWAGHNTDAAGFADALLFCGFEAAGKTALVFGAGGAAKAVLQALGSLKAANILLTNRNPGRAEEIAGRFQARAVPMSQIPGLAPSVDLLVNATSASGSEESPALARLAGDLRLASCGLVLDINYGRKENFWQRLALDQGIPFVDGISMLVHQARRSFELWTGIEVAADEFLGALEGMG